MHKIFYMGFSCQIWAQWLHPLRFWDSALPADPSMGRGERARKSHITHTTAWLENTAGKSPSFHPWRSLGGFSVYFKFMKENILTGHWNWSLKERSSQREPNFNYLFWFFSSLNHIRDLIVSSPFPVGTGEEIYNIYTLSSSPTE